MGCPALQSLYLCKKINVISDHKPLQPLFSGKSLTSCSPRTARLLLKVIDRDVRFFYEQGPSMHLSDPLSRLSSHNTQDGNKEGSKCRILTTLFKRPIFPQRHIEYL